MAITYPSFLPLPKVNSYTIQRIGNKTKIDVQKGSPRIEKIVDVSPVIFNVELDLSSDQMELWDGFYTYDLNDGLVNVDMFLRVDYESRLHSCLIVNEPEIKQNGKRWSVNLQLFAIEKNIVLLDRYNQLKSLINSGIDYDLFNTFVEGVWA